MAIVYRSVRVILLNETDDVLTVAGTEVLVGAWSAGQGLKNGERVARQGARAFGTESTALGRGTEAFVRLGSITGYLHVHWYMPWVGDLQCEAEHDDENRRVTVQRNDEDPAALVVLITLSPRAAPPHGAA